MLLVVNAYRPETVDVPGVLRHLRAIEGTSGFAVTGLISNTHVCRETTLDDVAAGYRLTHDVSAATGIPISFVCGVPAALDGLQDRLGEPVLGGVAHRPLPARRVDGGPQWRSEREIAMATTGTVTFNRDICKGCGLCVVACATHLLELDEAAINRRATTRW